MGTLNLKEEYISALNKTNDLEERIKELEDSNQKTNQTIDNYFELKKNIEEVKKSIDNVTSQFILIIITFFATIFTSVAIYSFFVSLLPAIIESQKINPSFQQLILGIAILLSCILMIIHGIIYFLFSAYRHFILGHWEKEHKFKKSILYIFLSNIGIFIFLILVMMYAK